MQLSWRWGLRRRPRSPTTVCAGARRPRRLRAARRSAACAAGGPDTYRAARGHDGLGLGDVKLAAAGGAWIGWTMLPVVIEIAALSALVVFLIAPRLAGRPAHWNARLPFGSFLAPAIWATWLIETRLIETWLAA